MTVSLQRASPAEADAWLARGIQAYAADLALSGMDKSAAAKRARDDNAQLLPQGIDTPGQLFSR
jgi:hypothetical protein